MALINRASSGVAPVPPPLPHLMRRIGYFPPPLQPLDMAELAALGTLPLRARRLADALGIGGHTSHRKGSSIEFADYRDYQMGDDLRRVDWRLFARTDRLHLREAHEETPLRVVLLLDVSPSMAYASRKGTLSKLDYARALLGALALLVHRQRDACGAGLISDDLSTWLPPSRSPARLRAVWGLLDKPVSGTTTSLARALHTVLEVAPRRCLFIVASDFYEDPSALTPVIQRLRHEHHDLLALQIADPAEVDFNFQDPGVFFDIETGSELLLDPAAAARDYRAKFAAHRTAVSAAARDYGCDALELRTDEPPLDALRACLARRAGQR
jgi:uncharacterized protein (DUF58 family)